MRPTPDIRDDEALRHSARRANWIGLYVWPSFTLLDAYMCFVVFPGAPFLLFVTGRVVVAAVLLAGYWATWRPEITVRALARWHAASFVMAALTISLMAIPLGGLLSSYMHGISLVLLVRAAVIPEHWRRAVPLFAAIGLTFPVVTLTHMLVSLPAREAAREAGALVSFGANYVFVIASAAVGLLSGHIAWAASQQLYRARRLGRYRLQAPIGRGGMGEVWLAWDLSLRRNVALKLLRPGGAPAPDALRRFEREAQTASQMRIPHSVQIYDFGVSDDGIHFIAMEYLSGMNLETLVQRHGPLPPGRAVHFARQICSSLEEAHAAGIIHRDVKPSNLFVSRVAGDPDFLKLLDFGIARLSPSAGNPDTATRSGALWGTPAYLAPELWEGAEANERSDLYAVGVTLYFLLTGQVPFQGMGPVAVMLRQREGDAHAPSVQRGEPLPPNLDAIVLRAMAKRSAERYQSAIELRKALEDVPVTWTVADAEAFWRSQETPAPDRALGASGVMTIDLPSAGRPQDPKPGT